jgi:hypothetical protein
MRRQLGQLRPANTSAASLFTPAVSKEYRIYYIQVSNTTGSAASASVYHDIDGTTYTEVTALLFGKVVPANDYITLSFIGGIGDYQSTGNIGVETSVNNALTFTLYGEILGEEL